MEPGGGEEVYYTKERWWKVLNPGFEIEIEMGMVSR